MHEDVKAGAAGEPPRLGLAPGSRVAGFTVEGPLASGSFGDVYRATRDGRAFAIKLVELGPRGDREVDALRRVRHPNVVGCRGYGLWPDDAPRFLVLALELVEGLPLDEWARKKNPSAAELVGQVLLPLARTLAAVHASGVVHRDVKEANILLREADGQPVLVDFGAAGYEGAPRLTLRLPPGTPEYRSPEVLRFAQQWEGELYPARPGDDLWALGVATYCLLTRTLPFGDRSNPGLMRAILNETPVPPHERNPRVPRALSGLCLRLLEKAPEVRYADAEALAQALEGELARADESWSPPLFPVEPQPEPPAPAALGHPTSRRWRAAGLVLTWVLVATGALSALTGAPSAQRVALAPPPPPQQAGSRQELAPQGATGEVDGGAEPPRSPTPAPVASATPSEEPKMMKSKTLRGLVTATAVTCTGCATTPKPPPRANCPPGSDVTHERFGFNYSPNMVVVPTVGLPRTIPVKEGDITVSNEITGEWGSLPLHTLFHGRLFFGKDRVYGRFTQAILPGGETAPVCLQMQHGLTLGWPMAEGSTRDDVRISAGFALAPVIYFE